MKINLKKSHAYIDDIFFSPYYSYSKYKKYRLNKRNYSVSEFQKSERDFAFVIDKNYKAGDVEKIISEADKNFIK